MAKKLGYKESVDKAVEDNKIDSKISKFLYLIAENTLNDKANKDTRNKIGRQLFKDGFELHDPNGTHKIGSKLIQQCLWRLRRKIKFLDYTIECTGKDEATERLTTEGLRTVMVRGGLNECLRDKAGVFQNMFMYGDGFLFFGKGENDENPVSYRALRNEDVYYDNYAYGVRGVRPATKMAVVFAFEKDDAYSRWPELKEKGIWGRIPGTYQDEDNDTERDDSNVVEVAWAWDKANKEHVIFAGVQAYLIDSFEGEEYPCVKNDKPYIPVFQFMFQPSLDQFHNYGLIDMVYDLAIITRKLMNMEIGHIEENVYPVTLINAPQSKVDELVEKMAMANKARVNGKKPFVAMEFDPNGGGQSVSTQTLLTQNLFNEWQIVWDRLVREVSRLGINIDDADRGSGITAYQVATEEMVSNDLLIGVQKSNASETRELLECSMDAVTEYVSPKNKTSLNLRTRIRVPDGNFTQVSTDVTMGMLSKELKDNPYFPVINDATGVDKSDLLQITGLSQQLGLTPYGTPEYAELYSRLSRLRGVDLDLAQQPIQQAPPQKGGAPIGSEAIPPEAQQLLESNAVAA
jgi:hypothetical protein